jgi:hypothetical protein
MAIDDINNATPVLPTALQGRTQTFVPLAASLLATVKDPVAVAVAATQNLTPAQQAALLGSEALQTLSLDPTFPAQPLLADGTILDPPSIIESEGLSPAQQAALAVNETVQTALETQNLTPAQQTALAVKQATQNLAAPLTLPEAAIPAAATGVSGQNLPPGLGETIPTTETPAVSALPTGVNPATTAATPTATSTPPTETTVADEVLNLTQPAAAQAIPFEKAFAVYEIRNPNPPPSEPVPIRKKVHPPLPIGRVRPIDPLVLRQEWEKRKKNRRLEETPPPPPLAEKTIRDLVKQANEDLSASGVPVHLVLAQKGEGFALDVYDCSDEAACWLAHEVPLDSSHLMTVLDNLEHETGIIVNIKT